MDNFEKNIRKNASEFDEHKPDRAKMWTEISKELETESPKVILLKKFTWFKYAASFLVLFGIAGFIAIGVYNTTRPSKSYASKELFDIDVHYKSLVSYQVQLVKNHSKLSEEDKTEFLSFMGELDLEYEELKLEMLKNLDNELILEAIVSNYKKRIELIEKLLKQINRNKNIDDNYGYTL